MAVDDMTCVNVTQNALLKFIELIACAGCGDIKVSQGDRDWCVNYKTPFTREVKACDEPEGYVLPPKNERLDTAGPLNCQSCIKIKACKQMYVETGTWPVPHDCFVPDRYKKYPQFEMDSCEECNAIHSCIARYDMDRTNWKCAKGKVHLNFTELHDAPYTPQMIAEADCEGDRAKCGDACHKDAGTMPEFNRINPANCLNCSNCVKLNSCIDKYARHMFVYCDEHDKVTRSKLNG